MTQSEFADYIELAPATLSSIFNGRTRPTLNVVEALKKKIPNINVEWLMFGIGDMYLSGDNTQAPLEEASEVRPKSENPMLDFDQAPAPTPQNGFPTAQYINSVRSTRPEIQREEIKIIDKSQRRIKEIRVFYDDQTWETFVPSNK